MGCAVAAAPWACTEVLLEAAQHKKKKNQKTGKSAAQKKSDSCTEMKKNKKKKAGYVELWFLRGLVARRLSLSKKKFNVKGCMVSRLSSILPDSYDWQKKFCRILGWNPDTTPVEQLYEEMEYEGTGPLRIRTWTYQGVGVRSGAGQGYIYVSVHQAKGPD